MQYQKMVVIFIDIIGSKEITGFDQKYEIHKLFHTSVRESQLRQGSEAHSHVAYDRRLFSFSDCAYVTYFYKSEIEENRKNDEELLQTALFNTSILALRLASRGFRVRGGVTFGDTFVDEDGCSGPAVEEAYRLESKVALFPRILLSQEIGKSQYDFETEIQSSPGFSMLNRMTRDRVSRIVNLDDDGNFYLNIFYQLEMDNVLIYDGEELTLDKIKSVLLAKIAAERIKHKDDERISIKLDWFAKYLSNVKCCVKEGQATFSVALS